MTQAYPLHWPPGYPRTKSHNYSRFKTGLDGAVNNVTKALRQFAHDSGRDIKGLIISSNVTLMNMEPKDGGVAIYFQWDNMDCCIAVDAYPKPADNLQAIMHIIEAERTKLRHGGLNIVRATFRGFAALPPPTGPDGQIAPPWWHVLGFESEGQATLLEAETRWRAAVKTKHPDVGGNAAEFNVVAEIDRELKMRAEVYPRQVFAKKLRQWQADRQIAVLRAIRDVVERA